MKEVLKAGITSVAVPIALLALVFVQPLLPGNVSTNSFHRAVEFMRAPDLTAC